MRLVGRRSVGSILLLGEKCRLVGAEQPTFISGGYPSVARGNQAERTRRALVVEWFFSPCRSQPQTYRLRHRKISS